MDYKNVNDYEVMYMIRENDDMAEYIMYDKYHPLLKKIASKYFLLTNQIIPFDDLVQEARLGLDGAIKSYSEYNNVLFYTYAKVCIERRLSSFCRNMSSGKHYVFNNSMLDEFIEDKSDNTDNCLDLLIENEDFVKFKHSLDFIDSNIFELKYNGFTYIEIAQLLDISYRYLMYRIRKIRDKLKIRNKLLN